MDATVDRGLKEINEDPRRSIRKLADLGKQFNNGRFMQDLYAIFQDLLRNDDSPYYTAIEHLLQNTDRKALKDFGINMGYNKGRKEDPQLLHQKGIKGSVGYNNKARPAFTKLYNTARPYFSHSRGKKAWNIQLYNNT